MNLNINFEETISTGVQVVEKGDSFQACLNKVRQANTELGIYWQGEDANKYLQAIERQLSQVQKLRDAIDSMGIYLQEAGKVYREMQEANKSGINQ